MRGPLLPEHHLDGVEEGSTSASGYDFTTGGFASYANSGTPGAEIDYIGVGSEPIDFDPEGGSSSATSSTGSESSF